MLDFTYMGDQIINATVLFKCIGIIPDFVRRFTKLEQLWKASYKENAKAKMGHSNGMEEMEATAFVLVVGGP